MRRPRAVVFDDDGGVRSVLSMYLGERGYEVLACESPASVCSPDGSAMCAGGDACCDVLLTDIEMPGGNGLELLERQTAGGCRLDGRSRAAMSGWLDGEVRRRVGDLGCAFFEKPLSLRALDGWLRACEGRQDLRQPLATRRREERLGTHREVSCEAAGGMRQPGAVLNVSPSGLCLRTTFPLPVGEALQVCGSHFPAGHAATVRWLAPARDGGFLAGVHCGGPVPDARQEGT